MEYDIYCDESFPDLLSSKKTKNKYMIIGSLWLEKNNRLIYKNKIHKLRDKFLIGSEFKWRKISPSKFNFYESLIDFFISENLNLRFRAIVIDKTKVNLICFHNNDQELGFYKFYYQMLHHWILDFNSYNIFCDYKKNRLNNRLNVLKNCLSCSNLSSKIEKIQAIHSNESVLLQLTDVLIGIVGAKYNNSKINNSKIKIINCLEKKLNHKIEKTNKYEQKFNIFEINLQGGW